MNPHKKTTDAVELASAEIIAWYFRLLKLKKNKLRRPDGIKNPADRLLGGFPPGFYIVFSESAQG